MTTAIAVQVTFQEMEKLAEAIASSGLFGMKNASQALALMAIAQAEGQHPALAARDYHIVQGRPVLKSDAMLARFQAAGGRMTMIDYTDAKVSAEFTHPQGGTVTIDWDIERAKRAGLAGKDNYKNYPRQMLRARVISEGIRTVFPGATQGLLTPEEAADAPSVEAERDVTPAKAPLSLAERVAQVGEQMKGSQETTLAEVVAAIQRAETSKALAAAGDLAKQLKTDGDKAIARTQYAARQKALAHPLPPEFTYAQIAEKINGARTEDELDLAASLIESLLEEPQREELRGLYNERRDALAA